MHREKYSNKRYRALKNPAANSISLLEWIRVPCENNKLVGSVSAQVYNFIRQRTKTPMGGVVVATIILINLYSKLTEMVAQFDE